ncbi:MAG: DUF4349 domain-containing protein [Phycisphaerales bacterium]|nr:DUF4349 domain-containing protein [Phycisphaerales bacterium]
MSDEPMPDVTAQLGQLTTWSDETPGLWKAALDQAESARRQPERPLLRLFNLAVPWPVAATLALAALVVVLVAVTVPNLMVTPARDSARRVGSADQNYSLMLERGSVPDEAMRAGDPVLSPPQIQPDTDFRYLSTSRAAFAGLAAQAETDNIPPIPSMTRHVVRKANVELRTDDVHAAFHAITQLISEAGGEYIQESSLRGAGESARAEITMRIASRRLSQLLNALRDFGEVTSEKLSGEDVTSQVVDVEARLRNERRIEEELLELLAQRDDAPLTDILKLRKEISGVRDHVERLVAQRDRLSRLVSLSSVLVIIRPADHVEEPEQTASLWSSFTERVGGAWRTGLDVLSATIAKILQIAVAGLVWWIMLVVVILLVRNHIKKAADHVAQGK